MIVVVVVTVAAAAAISGGGERDGRQGPTAGRGESRGGEARKLYSLKLWKGFDTASSGDDGPRSGAAFRCRGTTGWRGTVRSLFLSLFLSLGPSHVPPPVLPLGRPSVTLPHHAILSHSRRARRVPLNARCAVMHRAGGGIASTSHKVCSCREYELPLPNQYHSLKKRGKRKKRKKNDSAPIIAELPR